MCVGSYYAFNNPNIEGKRGGEGCSQSISTKVEGSTDVAVLFIGASRIGMIMLCQERYIDRYLF